MREIPYEENKKVELNILCYVADFCDKHDLKYYLAYGTLIGAVRHKGFIPWDDDIDIQMPREDYCKMMDIFNSQKEIDYYKLVSPRDEISRHPFVKIIDTRTVKLEPGVQYGTEMLGVDIDIFPIDGQPDSDKQYVKFYKRLHRIYEYYGYRVISNYATWKRRIGIPIIRLFIGSKEQLLDKAKELHEKYSYDSSKYVGTVESAYNGPGNRVLKTCYENYVMVEFEGREFKAPINYDEILTNLFGDYMQLPPLEQQVTHHSNNTYWKEEN